jgi:mono/diheme cytochrome c family protein
MTEAILVRPLALAALLFSAASANAVELSNYTGQELYKRFCASCHGITGEGDGPVASSMKVMTPDLTRIAKRQSGKFPAERLHQIIDGRLTRPPHGTRDMPVWGREFTMVDGDDEAARQRAEELIQKLVEHLRSIQK